MTNEIVKYGNQLNMVSFRNFNSREMNLFFSIVSRMRNKGTDTVTFSFEELKSLSNYKSGGKRFENDLKSTYSKMLELNLWYQNKDTYGKWNLFIGFEIHTNLQTVDVSVNNKLKGVLNNIVNWTRFSLEQFSELQSTYSKTMFRLLKQYRTSGYRYFKVDEFRNLLGVPKSYRPSNINVSVLKPIKEELTPLFKGLAVRKKYGRGRGKPVIGYSFSWKPEPNKADDFTKGWKNDMKQAIDNVNLNTELTDDEKKSAIARIKKKYHQTIPIVDLSGSN